MKEPNSIEQPAALNIPMLAEYEQADGGGSQVRAEPIGPAPSSGWIYSSDELRTSDVVFPQGDLDWSQLLIFAGAHRRSSPTRPRNTPGRTVVPSGAMTGCCWAAPSFAASSVIMSVPCIEAAPNSGHRLRRRRTTQSRMRCSATAGCSRCSKCPT